MFDFSSAQVELYNGHCIEKMRFIPPQSVDLILTDPPYGTTAAPWDLVIPLADMWQEIRRVLKPRGVVALFGSQPFTTAVIASNYKMYRYNWYWKKTQHSNPFLAKHQPLRVIEDVMVFYSGKPTYNITTQPTYIEKKRPIERPSVLFQGGGRDSVQTQTGYPRNVLEYARERGFHPTQKPVPLLEYLISVYTKVGETVLDFTMGSGSTGVACQQVSRRFIGIELDDQYYSIARQRMGV